MARTGTMLLAALAAIAGCSFTLPEVRVESLVEAESSTVYAANGLVVTVLHAEENRQSVAIAEVPEHVRLAVVAAEDRRFYDHHGLDVQALLRAGRADIVAGEITEGGSTITQQYVKIAVLEDTERTAGRKLREALLAVSFERDHTKDEILELYLNAVYFGHGAYGIEAAVQQYFAKPVGELTLGEAALLAGLIRAPERLDPWEQPIPVFGRRNRVLDRMVEEGFATEADAHAAKLEPLRLADPFPPSADRYLAPYFLEEVKRQILDDPTFGPTPYARRQLLFTGGLAIHTTLDPRLQLLAEHAVDTVLPQDDGPAAALVAIEPATGAVRAMVGGSDFFGSGEAARFNLATQGGRQVGSAFKPFVLAAALEQGVPLATRFAAPASISFSLPYGQIWNVSNYDGDSPAPDLDLVDATVRSVNTVYAQLIMAIGPQAAVDTAARLGVASPLQPFPSAVLGANDVTPMDMAAAYGTIANRGTRVTPWLISRVVDRHGTVLFEHHADPQPAIDPVIADTVTAVLEQAVQRGTGQAASIDRPVAGKTGTAQEWRDAWFCGFTPDLMAAVWVGFPGAQVSMRPPTTPIRVTGGSWPARIWQRFMVEAMAPLPPRPFTPPPAGALPAPPGSP